MNKYKYLKTELKSGVFYIELTRKKSMNALNIATLDELKRVFLDASKNSKVKIIVLHSNEKNFSAGADIKEKQKKQNNLERWQRNYGKECIEAILSTPQITICVTNGYTLGGAAVIATACDFRIGNKDTIIGYPEIILGMNLNWLGLPLLQNLVGSSKTKEMVISGSNYSTKELEKYNFFDELFDGDKKIEVINKWIKKFKSKSPLASQMIKRSINVLAFHEALAIMHMDYDQFLLTQNYLDS
ncbi:enoyl-CoA hydratase/isomerase family protein [SAR86 cluster bacterium]|nr:enoyl-CoA hydratase/isomerase family protein [SAR86 cluster bacterium]